MQEITITIPSKGRPKKLAQCLKSIMFNSIEAKTLVAVTCYKDLPYKELYNYNAEYYATALPTAQAQNFLFAKAKGHILPLSDDVILDSDCLKNATDCLLQNFPDFDGVIGLATSNMESNDTAFMLVGTKYANRFKARQLFNPQYKKFYADTEFGDSAKAAGKFIFCKEAKLEHHHPAAGYEADKTHTQGRASQWKHDNEIYHRRKNEQV